jgi:hypothetical protein
MGVTVKITTNNKPRPVIDAWSLTATEREQFDYLDWEAIDDGRDSASFFRYKGELYNLGEFTRDYGILKGAGLPEHLSNWDGYMSDSAFSATVVRYVNDLDEVVVGWVYS